MTAAVPAHPIVGVLGGMGPEATVDFMRRVIAATPARDDADHIHMIVDCNPKIPSRIAALIEGTGTSPAPELCRMARSLEEQGASVLAMPCNTAHHYAPDIQKSVSIPLLDMPVLTADKLAGLVMSNRRVGLLASSAVVKLKHYEKLLQARGLTTVIPGDQAQLMAIIRAVKTGDTGASQRQQFLRIAEALMAQQCDVLLVACTELSLFTADLGEDMPVVDSLDVLVREVTAFVRQFPSSMQPKFAVGQS
jgi:aspartate racemase